jgi:hypothetical protein
MAGDRSHSKTVPAALLGAVVVALTTVGVAAASGGLSIAHAPLITPGAKLSENSQVDKTAPGGDAVGQGCFNDVEYWKLPLKAGDKVVIRGTESIAARGFLIAVFAPKTTDKNVASATSFAHGFTADHAVRFKVSTTGAYPLVAGPNCYNGTDGPYTFVVTVTHSATG